jgi:hypothetical protein
MPGSCIKNKNFTIAAPKLTSNLNVNYLYFLRPFRTVHIFFTNKSLTVDTIQTLLLRK